MTKVVFYHETYGLFMGMNADNSFAIFSGSGVATQVAPEVKAFNTLEELTLWMSRYFDENVRLHSGGPWKWMRLNCSGLHFSLGDFIGTKLEGFAAALILSQRNPTATIH